MKNEMFEFLGEELYKIRKQKGFSQEELAEKINVSRQSIHLWEAGKIIPDLENITNLCNVLEITVDKITNGFEIIQDKSFNQNRRSSKFRILKIFLIIVAIIVLLYLFLSIRRSIILINTNKKFSKYIDIQNFHYTKEVFEEKDLKPIWSYKNEIYFKDGIQKNVYTDSYGNKTIHYLNINTNEYILVDETNKSARIFEDYDASHFKDAIMISEVFPSRVTLGEKEDLVNFIYGFKPTLRIESKKDKYNYYWSTEIRDYKQNVVEKVDKETGLLDAVYVTGSDSKYTATEYEIKINCVEENDVLLPNLENYKKEYIKCE